MPKPEPISLDVELDFTKAAEGFVKVGEILCKMGGELRQAGGESPEP